MKPTKAVLPVTKISLGGLLVEDGTIGGTLEPAGASILPVLTCAFWL